MRPAANALSLFNQFNEQGVRYCHWKSNEHLLQGLTGKTDLDILIDPADSSTAYRLLSDNNYKRVISHPWKRYSAVEDWIGLDEEQMLQTHLHVHYRLLTGLKNVKDQYFSFNRIVLDNSVLDKDYDIRICNPNIETILLIIRAVFKRSSFSHRRSIFEGNALAEYEYLKNITNRDDVARYAQDMFSESTSEQILRLYENPNDLSVYNRLRRNLITEECFLQRNTRINAEACYLRRILAYKTGKLLRCPVKLKKKTSTGGKLISFIGVDGAGKTTLATFYADWLSWKIDCDYVYLGTGDGKSSLLNRIKKKIYKRKTVSSDMSNNSSERSNTSDKLGLKKKIRWTLTNIVNLSNSKYKYRTLKRIHKRVIAGEIIVTDRYPQMTYKGIYDGMIVKALPGNGLLAWYNNRLVKKEQRIFSEMCRFNPDLVVKLEVPVEVSASRKPCTLRELEVIKRKVEITSELHYKGSRELVVDSSGNLEDTKRTVVSLLWRYI